MLSAATLVTPCLMTELVYRFNIDFPCVYLSCFLISNHFPQTTKLYTEWVEHQTATPHRLYQKTSIRLMVARSMQIYSCILTGNKNSFRGNSVRLCCDSIRLKRPTSYLYAFVQLSIVK